MIAALQKMDMGRKASQNSATKMDPIYSYCHLGYDRLIKVFKIVKRFDEVMVWKNCKNLSLVKSVPKTQTRNQNFDWL